MRFILHSADAILTFGIANSAAKFVERETVQKRYFLDNALLNNYLCESLPRLLENVVAVHLHRIFGERLKYWRHGVEVDFYVPDEGLAVQVACDISDPAVQERELAAFAAMAKEVPLSRCVLVTLSTRQSEVVNGLAVDVLPISEFLLS